MSQLKDGAIFLISDVKAAAVTAGFTTGSGVATKFNWLPTDLGTLATAVGIILTCILIVSHILRTLREHRAERRQRIEHELRAEKLRLEIEAGKKSLKVEGRNDRPKRD